MVRWDLLSVLHMAAPVVPASIDHRQTVLTATAVRLIPMAQATTRLLMVVRRRMAAATHHMEPVTRRLTRTRRATHHTEQPTLRLILMVTRLTATCRPSNHLRLLLALRTFQA